MKICAWLGSNHFAVAGHCCNRLVVLESFADGGRALDSVPCVSHFREFVELRGFDA